MKQPRRDPALLQSIFDASIEGSLVVDSKGVILDANASCELMLGYSEEELQGLELELLLPEKFRKRHKSHLNKYVKNPETQTMGLGLNLWGLKKDGSEFPLDIILTPSTVNGKSVTIAFVKNATRRKKDLSLIESSNAVLIETNRKYSTLIGNLQGIVYRCQNDHDWTMDHISEGCQRITGYSSQEFMEGMVHFSHITFKEDKKKVWDDTQKAIREKKPFLLNFRIRAKNGKIKYLQELGQGIYDKSGQLVALEGFISDVTAQKKAEEELRQKEAMNKALLEAMPDMMFIQDYRGNYLEFYAPESKKQKVNNANIIGKNMKEILPPKVNAALKKAHQNARKYRLPQLVEYVLEENGERNIYEGRAVPLNQHGVLTIVRDVTEKKRTEQELRDSEAKIKAILEAIPDRMIIVNKKGNYLDFYEPNEPDYLLIPKEEVVGGNMKKLLPKEVHDQLKKAIAKTIEQKKTQIVEYALERKNGLRYYETRTVFLKDDQVLAIARDITQRKNLEAELKETLAKNKAILNALPDVIILNDKKGNILEMHTPAPDLLIAPVTDLIRKNFRQVIPNEKYSEIKKAINKSQSTNAVQLLETTLPSKKGPVDFEARIVPLENGNSMSILRDITETKATRNTLFIRNRALDAAGNGIIIVDALEPDLPIIYSNNAFSEITGYSTDDVLGKNCRFLQNQDRQQKEIYYIREAIRKKRPCKTLLRNYRKDGSLFYNELTITPILNDKDQVTHFIGVQNDVTERRKEELLKEDMRHILEQIGNKEPLAVIAHTIVETLEKHLKNCMASILLLDQERQCLHKLAAPNLPDGFNKGIEGVKIGDMVGSCGTAAFLKQEVLAEDIATDPRWDDYKKLALEHGLKCCWSFPIFTSNKNVLGTLSIYCDRKRKPQKFEREIVSDFIDLTSVAIEQHRINVELTESNKQLEHYAQELEEKVEKRTNELKATVQKLVEANLMLKDQVQETKAAENRALASQEMFTAISKNLPKGVIIVYNADFEIVYIDGGEIKRMGFKKEQFSSKCIDDVTVFSKQRIARIKEDIKKTMAGERLSFEIKFKNKDYAVNSLPLMDHDDDNVKWSLFVYNDITKQKQAEASVRKALFKEQELNELKSRFISMASHEFRTPLSAISTSAILIDRHSELRNIEKIHKYVGQIQMNVENLSVILSDFLSLGKLEEGKVKAKPEKFDLVLFANNLRNELKLNLKRGQRIALNTNAEFIDVYLDSKLMHHILTNLISNAIKYSEEGQIIEVVLKKEVQSIVIEVKDQGIGIPEEEQGRLFHRFFRAGNSTNIEGTGLGLHIAQQYTELMGGKIGFESEKHVGSTFWVKFPLGEGC